MDAEHDLLDLQLGLGGAGGPDHGLEHDVQEALEVLELIDRDWAGHPD